MFNTPKLLRYVFFGIPLLFLFGSCHGVKKLKSGETLLVKNSVNINSAHQIKGKKKLKSSLEGVCKQKPNGKFLGLFPIHTQIKKSKREPLAVYDPKLTKETTQSMINYLAQKGYRDVEVRDTSQTKNKKTTVTYEVDPKQLYTVDSLFYICSDSTMQLLLNDLKEKTFLTPGAPVSLSLINKEKARIIEKLNNLGYLYFNKTYLPVPRAYAKDAKVNIYFDVPTPPTTDVHQAYRIGKVYVDPYFTYQGTLLRDLDTIIVQGVHFITDRGAQEKIKPQNILKSVFLTPGMLHRKYDLDKTRVQLEALDIIKTVNINISPDPQDSTLMNYEILLTQRYRMALGGDIEFNNSTYSNRNQATNLWGLAVSLNYRNRNLFKNAALFLARAQLGFELDFSPNSDQLLFSRNATAQTDLYIPRFVDPIKLWKGLRLIKVIRSGFYRELKDKAQTRLSFRFEDLSFFNFYDLQTFNGSFGYELKTNANNRFIFNQLGIDFTLMDKKELFKALEEDNPFLRESFNDQLFTGFLFKNFSYIYTGKTNPQGESWFFRGDAEFSGIEIAAINGIRNGFSSNKKTFTFLNDIEYAQYMRFDVDVRRYKQFSARHSVAFRANAGIAFPFGFSSEVPYVKQFFLGGPNSIRAWKIRELGPGAYLDTTLEEQEKTVPFYQAGNLKFEFNAEYRFDVSKIPGGHLEAAFFLDGGNIWTLKEDTARVGSQILWKAKTVPGSDVKIGDHFLKQLALGVGTGIRLDFKYFIIRFDAAIKMRNNFRDEERNSYWIKRDYRKLQLKDFNYNLAVGYPF